MNPLHHEFFLFVRIVAAAFFVAFVLAGGYLLKNQQRLFGADPGMPSENASSRTYAKVLVFAVWAHLLVFSAAALLMA
jgi:hypothetical protein